MIYIRRHREDENGSLIEPPQEWFESAQTATEIAIREKRNHDVDEDIYGHVHVRAALEKLFHDKCAYCESKMTAVADWNVEHFRPKGRVAEREEHAGYYWLVYDWNNLYPSCIPCNQRRKDKPRWGDLRYAGAGGKMDQFPLEDENTRAMSEEDDISQERLLLIDPCNDNPEDHLTYDIHGHISALDRNLRGRATIKVCNLRRRRLRDGRRDRINATAELLQVLRKVESSQDDIVASALKGFLQSHLLAAGCEYAGAGRAVENDPDAFGV